MGLRNDGGMISSSIARPIACPWVAEDPLGGGVELDDYDPRGRW